jgi:hypothetical protein
MYVAYAIILEKLNFTLNDDQHNLKGTDNWYLLKTISTSPEIIIEL